VVLNKDDYYGPGVATEKYDPIAQWAWLDEGNHAGKWGSGFGSGNLLTCGSWIGFLDYYRG
jgi:hypothetical protein